MLGVDPALGRLLTCYSYGMVLAKEKNDEKAMEYFIRSVHKYTMNWGCWLEMTSLISRVEDVSAPTPARGQGLTEESLTASRATARKLLCLICFILTLLSSSISSLPAWRVPSNSFSESSLPHPS